MSGPTGLVSLCEDVPLGVASQFNDGFRGMKAIQWRAVQVNSSIFYLDPMLGTVNYSNPDPNALDAAGWAALQSQQFLNLIAINNLLKKFDSVVTLKVVIPQLTMLGYSSYAYQTSYQNFYGGSSTTVLIVQTSTNKGPRASIDLSQNFVFNTWKPNQIQATFNLLQCLSGSFSILYEPLDIRWDEISNATNAVKKTVFSKRTTANEVANTLTIDSYTRLVGFKYTLTFTAVWPAFPSSAFASYTVTYVVVPSPIVSYILGGNKMQSYSLPASVYNEATDPDVPPLLQGQGLDRNWSCTNMNTGQICKDVENNPIQTPNNTKNLTYAKKRFEPYNSFRFSVNSKHPRALCRAIARHS